ncbi:MAG: hypothetical protein M3380_07675, partial [Chloroflexota bacterium]|nr:hypothetical protein [Chloroflexota bacterium]
MTTNLRILAIILVMSALVLRSTLLAAAAFMLGGATIITGWWIGRVERRLRVRQSVPGTVNYGEEVLV